MKATDPLKIILKPKILAEAQVLEPGSNDLGSPVSFYLFPLVRMEKNTTCASESFSHLPSVLKSLTNLRLLVMTSLVPT